MAPVAPGAPVRNSTGLARARVGQRVANHLVACQTLTPKRLRFGQICNIEPMERACHFVIWESRFGKHVNYIFFFNLSPCERFLYTLRPNVSPCFTRGCFSHRVSRFVQCVFNVFLHLKPIWGMLRFRVDLGGWVGKQYFRFRVRAKTYQTAPQPKGYTQNVLAWCHKGHV